MQVKYQNLKFLSNFKQNLNEWIKKKTIEYDLNNHYLYRTKIYKKLTQTQTVDKRVIIQKIILKYCYSNPLSRLYRIKEIKI